MNLLISAIMTMNIEFDQNKNNLFLSSLFEFEKSTFLK